MSYFIKQSSATRPLLFLLVQSADHISPATGLTPTVTLSKAGAAFAAPAGAISEVGNGWYQVAANATDSNTLGPLVLHATATGADPTDMIYRVVAFDPDSATNLGLSVLDANISTRSTLAAGAQMDLVNSPNATAVTAIQSGLATASALSTVNTTVGNVKAKTDLIGTDSADSPNAVTAQTTVATNLDTTVSSRSTYSGGPVASVTAPVELDLTQAIPTTNGSQTVGDALNAARAQAPTGGSSGSGTGAYTITVAVDDPSGNPISGATVRLTSGGSTYTATSSAIGDATFALDAGTYELGVTAVGYSYTPTSQTISGSATIAVTMAALPSIPAPTAANTVTTVITTVDASGNVVPGATLNYAIVESNDTGYAYNGSVAYATSSALGQIQLQTVIGATYRLWNGISAPVTITIPTTATSPFYAMSFVYTTTPQ